MLKWTLLIFTLVLLCNAVALTQYRNRKDCKLSLVKCVRDMGHNRYSSFHF